MTRDRSVIGPVESTGADLVPLPAVPSPVALPLPEQVREYIRASKAENTLRGYTADWRDFCAWCEGHGLSPLPATPESVAAYIAECAAHLKPGSIRRMLIAIGEAHKAARADSPTHSGVATKLPPLLRWPLRVLPLSRQGPHRKTRLASIAGSHGRPTTGSLPYVGRPYLPHC